jgi:hypothetical protein
MQAEENLNHSFTQIGTDFTEGREAGAAAPAWPSELLTHNLPPQRFKLSNCTQNIFVEVQFEIRCRFK